LNRTYSDQVLSDEDPNRSPDSNINSRYADWSGFCEVESEPVGCEALQTFMPHDVLVHAD